MPNSDSQADLQTQIERLRADLDALVASGGAAVADAVSQAGDRARARADELAGCVRARPITSVAIAAAVGFVFARITR